MNIGSRTRFTAFSLLTLVALGYCLVAYSYLQQRLTPQLEVPTATMDLMEKLLALALVIIGLYHLYLLFRSLTVLPKLEGRTLVSALYLVLVILSGILVVSDAVMLLEIGKEYTLFDVSGEWLILNVLAVLHTAVVFFGILVTFRSPESGPIRGLLGAIRTGSDTLFLVLHEVAFFCGIIGLGVIGLAYLDIVAIKDVYRLPFLLSLSLLSLLPLALFAVYWVIKNRNRPVRAWLDEKQASDTCVGALAALGTGVPILIAVIVLAALDILGTHTVAVLEVLFFVQVIVFSAVITSRGGGFSRIR